MSSSRFPLRQRTGRSASGNKSSWSIKSVLACLILLAINLYLSQSGGGEIDLSPRQTTAVQSDATPIKLRSRLPFQPLDSVVGQLPDPAEIPKQKTETLVLKTKYGKLKIVLRPDLSKDSIEYIHNLVKEGCETCTISRAEKGSMLMGKIENELVSKNTVRGECPQGAEKPKKCPSHDVDCGCHGPVMTKGMVAWIGGGTGPSFFINTYEKPATWWETQHTVWGEIQDSESFEVIDRCYELPVSKEKKHYLEEKITFSIKLEEEDEDEDEDE